MNNYAKNNIQSCVMDINPEVAQQMLNTSPYNRRLRKDYISKLAKAIKRGEWRVSHQGIGFNELGELRDGHHRLSAVIESGCNAKFLVTFGLPNDVYDVVDLGVKRTFADVAGIDKRESEIINLCAGIYFQHNYTYEQCRPLINSKIHETAKDLLGYCGSTAKFFSSVPIRAAVTILVVNKPDNRDYAFEQYRAQITGNYDALSNISKSFRRQYDSGKIDRSGGGAQQRYLFARAIKVFDCERKDYFKTHLTDADTDSAIEFARSVIGNYLVSE